MDKSSEIKAVEAFWSNLDDSSIIRDVLFKGKFIQNAIKFISERNSITIEEAKGNFLEVCDNIISILIKNKQTFRACHVLKNAQINELYYFYNLYLETSDTEMRSSLNEYLRNNSSFKENEQILQAYHTCFKLLKANIQKHTKYLENLNRVYNNSAVNVDNIVKTSYAKFMIQPVQWRNDIAVEVFFKSKREPNIFDLLPVLNKYCFFSYIIQNELHGLLRKWLYEQYLMRAGNPIPSTLSDPSSFDEALNTMFRKWNFEESMMSQVSKKQKDVIRNEFAKLGLFDSRENTRVDRKLNRFFTTHTFPENFPSLKDYEITKFVLENSLIDLLPQKFINHQYIQSVMDDNDESYPNYDELMLLQSTKNLLTKETNLESFVNTMNMTSRYIQKYDNSFNENQNELRFMNEIVTDNPMKLEKIAEFNTFLRNLLEKFNSDEAFPTAEELLENYHSINFDYIKDEFQNTDSDYIPSFDDANLTSIYGEENNLTYLDYISKYQGFYASYVFLLDTIKSSMTIQRPAVVSGCEEVVKLIIQNHEDRKLVNHAISFLETFSIDTRNLRCYLQLLKLKANKEVKNFEKFLDKEIKISTAMEDIKNVEALEVFYNVNRINPARSYLNTFMETNDWFKLIVMAQYFNYPIRAFISLCQENIKDRIMCDNLVRAISYEASMDQKRSLSKKPRALKSPNDSENLFKGGKYLDSKHDLFAILLKCDENTVRIDKPFEEFQKFFFRESEDNDLLYEARKYDWPLLAILAGTTKLYRIKYCWLTWTIISSKFKFDKKFTDVEELTTAVFEHCIRTGYIRTLDDSMHIFYPEAPIKVFTKFLKDTAQGNFNGTESLLKLFIVKLNESDFKINILKGKLKLIPFIIHCLIVHLQHNIKFSNQQQEYLACVHRSEIDKFDERISFELMRSLCKVVEQTNVEINYEALYECEKKSSREIERVCDELIRSNHFKPAIDIANLTNKSKTDFIFKYWLHMRNSDSQKEVSFDIEKYLKFVEIYGLGMDVFIKFLKIVIDDMDECAEKYNIMVFILRNSIKSDLKNLDELEYEIIHLYLRLKVLGVKVVTPLMSLYYENVIKAEKSLIHNNLFELKAIAMIDDLKISQPLTNEQELEQLDQLIFHLMDINDIVQVLRIQAMYCHAPEDLKILVYMLSVSEGITSIYDITKQERQIISNYGQMSKRFNRLALRALRPNISNSFSMDSSLYSGDHNESSILDEPSRYIENKETLQALQGLLFKLKHGVKYGQRIVLIYRISLFLHEQTFNDLIKVKGSFEFLQIVSSSACENKLIAMNDIIEAMEMSRQEVAQFIAKEITVCIIKTRFLQFNKDMESSNTNLAMNVSLSSSLTGSRQSLDDIWGFSLSKDLHLILELCKGRTTLLGTYLIKFYKIMSQSSADIPIKLESADEELEMLCELLNHSLSPQVMSLKKQNIIRVELLTTAHDCFCHECSTEGIGEILHLSKSLINELAEKKNFNLIVKLMCGIGRYREMFYCFDILIKNEAFETLLGQFSDKQTNGLKNALLSYLNEYHPNNIEYYKMCASHFLMHTELAKIYKSNVTEKIRKLLTQNYVKLSKSARILTNQVQQIDIPYLKCLKNSLVVLTDVITDMVHATEMMTADKKIEMSLKYSAFCELIAMQIHLIKVGIESDSKICPCVLYQELNLEKSQQIAQYFANYELSVAQTAILNKNLDIPIDYTKVIFCRVLISGEEQYLQDFTARMSLTDLMIENILKLAKSEPFLNKREKILNDLCLMVRDVGLKFRLASLVGAKGLLQQLLNDEQSFHYILDSKYGTVDIY